MTSSASPSSKEEDIQLLDAKNEEDEEKVDVKKKRKKLPSCGTFSGWLFSSGGMFATLPGLSG